MKKIILLIIFVITSLFGADWLESENKTYDWNHYNIWLWHILDSADERAVYVNVNDFGLEYPVNLKAVSTYLWETGKIFSFKIYDKDGSTLLWNSADSSSIVDYNDVYLDTIMVMNDDFWVSLVPDSAGSPLSIIDRFDSGNSHTYTGSPGSWSVFSKEISTRYLLEQYTGIDIYPPSVRSIKGNAGYQQTDLEITIDVQDQNSVVSPMSAEYSLDAGVNWIPFTMNASKGNTDLRGSISGQIHNTSGLVKFLMEDDQSNSEWSDSYPINWSKDNPLFTEGFEDEFPPYLWTQQIAGAGFVQSNTINHSGKRSAVHLNNAGEQNDRLISPLIYIPDSVSVILSFWQKDSLSVSSNGIHEVSISTDGTNWTQLWSGVSIDDDFTEKIISLSSYIDQSVYIGWHYTGNNSDQWFIDDVSIICEDEAPFITAIKANEALLPDIGAYLNNDMEIELTLSSRVGIKSVTGHYSFDGGSTVSDAVFSKQGIEEIWTGSIPALDSVSAGTVYFEITDLGDQNILTGDYDIYFVQDTDVPVIIAVRGRTALINKDAKISITVNEESRVKICRGHYSRNDFVTQYDFNLELPKMHAFVYEGFIPAESEELEGKLKFTVEDYEGNILNSTEYLINWISAPPDSFDLRTSYPESYVTSVKSQLGGTCWAHGTLASMESNLLITDKWNYYDEEGEPNLAEYHLDWWNGFNQFNNDDMTPPTGTGLVVHEGGDYLISTAYFSRGEGAVRDIDAQSYFEDPDRILPSYKYYYPRDVEWYNAGNNLENLQMIKKQIMEYGVIATCMAYDAGFIDVNYRHYQPASNSMEPNHSVAIVGWNDSLLTSAPEGRGAWLCKNSWAATWGLSGYFWISYYDKHAGKHPEMGAVSFKNVEMMKYDNVYFHDYHGWRVTMPDVSEAFNKFVSEQHEFINAVSFYTAADSITYTVRIYDDFISGSLQNELETSSGTIANKGFHTIDLTNSVPISNGNDFYVYLSLSSGGQPIDQTSYVPVLLGSKNKVIVPSVASPDESFYYSKGSWTDLYNNTEITYPGTANFCIKALTNSEALSLQTPPNVQISLDTANAHITWDAVENANSYQIYSCGEPYGEYSLIGTSSTNSWSDPQNSYTLKFYYVIARTQSK